MKHFSFATWINPTTGDEIADYPHGIDLPAPKRWGGALQQDYPHAARSVGEGFALVMDARNHVYAVWEDELTP